MKRPGKSDPSRPREDGYNYKREFYRSSSVAEDYDFHRFSTPERQKRNVRKWAAIRKALRETTGVRTILDLPCGTGRFTGALAREGFEIVGSDISIEMLHKAASLEQQNQAPGQQGQKSAIRGYVQANAEHLPLRSDSLDCVVSIRFMMHVDPVTRVRMLREFHRVSRRWVIVDYRHCYSFRYLLTHTFGRIGIGRPPLSRVSRKELDKEFADAGFAIRSVIRVSAPLLSDKWIVLAERA
ncbi:MAG TPA: class I SAM-dependent methyltransferase [Steroidobacteraceae bacterium]|nr:class I SAM-dependent methyltransferase [Steroidobacteraceae bacterium]